MVIVAVDLRTDWRFIFEQLITPSGVSLATYFKTSFSEAKLVNCTLSLLYTMTYCLFMIIFRGI